MVLHGWRKNQPGTRPHHMRAGKSVCTNREHAMLERLEQQKKLTANQWRIILTANLGDMLDFFDFFLIGYVLAFILKDWHITYGQSAVILVSAGLGAVPGAFFWGWMGDRIGRRTVFMLTAVNVACATG